MGTGNEHTIDIFTSLDVPDILYQHNSSGWLSEVTVIGLCWKQFSHQLNQFPILLWLRPTNISKTVIIYIMERSPTPNLQPLIFNIGDCVLKIYEREKEE